MNINKQKDQSAYRYIPAPGQRMQKGVSGNYYMMLNKGK